MLYHFDLNLLLSFPVRESEDRKAFLIGALIILASFIIPIIPILLVTGYVMRIMRQVLAGESPRMVAWDDWEKMLVDGTRLFGARLVYMLPVLLVFLVALGILLIAPLLLEGGEERVVQVIFLMTMLPSFMMVLLMPVMLVLSVFLPAAELHLVARNEFAAAFRVREWWAIFRANWGGFLLALAITYAISILTSMLLQIAMITMVLICALPVLLPAMSMYLMLVSEVAFAQAYKEGTLRLESGIMQAP